MNGIDVCLLFIFRKKRKKRDSRSADETLPMADVRLNYPRDSQASLHSIEVGSTPGSSAQLMRSLSSESEPSPVPTRDLTRDSRSSLVEGSQVTVDPSHMETELSSVLQSPKQLSEKEPPASLSTSEVGSTRGSSAQLMRSLSSESEPSPVLTRDSRSSLVEGSQVTVDPSHMETELSSVLQSPKQLSEKEPPALLSTSEVGSTRGSSAQPMRSLSSESEPSPVLTRDLTRDSRSSLVEGSQVTVDPSHMETELSSVLQSPKQLSEKEPPASLSTSEVGSTRGSSAQLMRSLSSESEPSPVLTRDLTRDSRSSLVEGSQVTVDPSHMETELSSVLQSPKQLSEKEPPASLSTSVLRTSVADLPVSSVRDSTLSYPRDSQASLCSTDVKSVSSTPGSPTQPSKSFSSESEPSSAPTRDTKSSLIEGSQVNVDLSHMEPELSSILQSPKQLSEIEPPASLSIPVSRSSVADLPVRSIRDTTLSLSQNEITVSYPRDSQASLPGTGVQSVSSSTRESPTKLARSLSSESEPSPVLTRDLIRDSRSSLVKCSKVSLDLSNMEPELSSVLQSPKQLSEIEPPTLQSTEPKISSISFPTQSQRKYSGSSLVDISRSSKEEFDLTRDYGSYVTCFSSLSNLQSHSPKGFESKSSIRHSLQESGSSSSSEFWTAEEGEITPRSSGSHKYDRRPRKTESLPVIVSQQQDSHENLQSKNLPLMRLDRSLSLPSAFITTSAGLESVRHDEDLKTTFRSSLVGTSDRSQEVADITVTADLHALDSELPSISSKGSKSMERQWRVKSDGKKASKLGKPEKEFEQDSSPKNRFRLFGGKKRRPSQVPLIESSIVNCLSTLQATAVMTADQTQSANQSSANSGFQIRAVGSTEESSESQQPSSRVRRFSLFGRKKKRPSLDKVLGVGSEEESNVLPSSSTLHQD